VQRPPTGVARICKGIDPSGSDYNGTNFTLTVPGAKQVTYEALLKNTQK